MEELNIADHRIKTAQDNYERDYAAQITKLTDMGNSLKERLNGLNEKKIEVLKTSGNVDITEDDLIEINAGGKIVAAKRSTLTQLKGSRFEALFSGRWDKELQRDSHGRIFLDVNFDCFQAIVDYLNEMAISSEDDPPKPPSVNDDQKLVLQHQLELFGLFNLRPPVKMPDSCIVKDEGNLAQLHDWLKEDDADGEFDLLYRSTRDDLSASSFHSKCDNQGCTLTIIEATDGFVFGGYSNTPWTSDDDWHVANKAFLFVLPGNGITSPCKMKLKNANDGRAVHHVSSICGAFGTGHDLYVNGSNSMVYLNIDHTYDAGPSQLHSNSGIYKTFAIKEMEVFQVSVSSSSTGIATTNQKPTLNPTQQMEPVTVFSEAINEVINAKQESLLRAEAEVLHLEDSFKDEHRFITTFASGDAKDVVSLNVSGTMMATKRLTLQTAEDSVLAQQFDDTKWTNQRCNGPRVKEWTPRDVGAWAKNIDDISDKVANVFVENEITGNELLALGIEGLKMLGIKRTGTVCLLSEEIKLLKQATSSDVTLIEHSPYCFGKILDHLRLKQLHAQGLAKEPALPKVDDSQKNRFEKVVKYYFPGDSAKFILG